MSVHWNCNVGLYGQLGPRFLRKNTGTTRFVSISGGRFVLEKIRFVSTKNTGKTRFVSFSVGKFVSEKYGKDMICLNFGWKIRLREIRERH
jgi:hypothetical protein